MNIDNSGDTCRYIDELSRNLFLLKTNQEFDFIVSETIKKCIPKISKYALFNYNWHSRAFEFISGISLDYKDIPETFHTDLHRLFDQQLEQKNTLYNRDLSTETRLSILRKLNDADDGSELIMTVKPVNEMSGLFYAFSDQRDFFDESKIALCRLISNMAVRAWKSLNFQAFQIREHKKAEKRFINQQQMMQEIFNYLPIQIYTKDKKGKYISLNKSTEEFLDLKAMDVIGKTTGEVMSPEIAKKFNFLEQKLWETRNPQSIEIEVNKHGESMHLYIGKKLMSTTDREDLLLAFAVDVTQTVMAHKSLEEQWRFIQQIIDTDPNYIYVRDKNGRYILVNQAIADLFQTSKDEIIRLGADIFHKQSLDEKLDEDSDRQVIENGDTVEIEESLMLPDHETRWIHTTKKPLPDKDGNVNVLGISIDITERKKHSDELLRAKRAKEQFLANMSHEIRTPINGIVGMINLLESTPTSQDQKKYLEAIKKSSENLKVIINDILDLSVIESGNLRLEKIGFKPRNLLNTLIESFRYAAEEKGIQLTLNYDPFVDEVLIGDPVRLNQILLNVIGNAVKFTREGYVRIYVLKLDDQDDTVDLQFIIQDSGIGIARKRLDTIFESFEQGDETITRKYGGTGLGLAIVKQLVTLQNGKITVESEEGHGSAFKIDIAYQKGSEEDLEQPSRHKDRSAIFDDQFDLSAYRILLVEDNEVNSLYSKKLMEKWHGIVDSAINGLEALEHLKKNDYDLILMDVQMPVMDGYEATRFIRTNFKPPKSEVKIIAITANAIKGDDQKCIDAGMNDYLSKPFKPTDLKEMLQKHLNIPHKIPDKFKNGSAGLRQTGHVTNLGYLQEISDNDKSFMLEMIQSFIDQTPVDLQRMKNKVLEKDWENVAYVAHKIKPSISFMGIDLLKGLIVDIENMAKNHKTSEIPRLMDKLEKICTQAYDELKQALTTMNES